MQSLMDGGVYIPSRCHDGSCGYCRSELVFGEVKVINDKRTSAEKKYNYIHPCSTYPLSDIEIIVR
jgi:ferredoxin